MIDWLETQESSGECLIGLASIGNFLSRHEFSGQSSLGWLSIDRQPSWMLLGLQMKKF